MSRATTPFALVPCTCPDTEVARALARERVGHGLAACVNSVPGLVSVYQWQGSIESDSDVESPLRIKTVAEHTDAVKACIESHLVSDLPEARDLPRAYDLPEVLELPVVGGSSRYPAWIRDSAS